MTGFLEVPVTPVDHAEDAMRGADIAMCGTNSIDPIFFADWIEEGMHLSSIKKPEIHVEAVQAADRVAIHTHDTEPIIVVSTSAASYKDNELKSWKTVEELDFESFPTLPELISGAAIGRNNDSEVTCFINNLGMGFQFAAAGSVIYRRAKEEGAGNELPTDWFTETVHP